MTRMARANVQWRVAALTLAIVVAVGLIGTAAVTAWQQFDQLRARLSVVELESFRIADNFQETFLSLNGTLMEFQIQRDPALWAQFLQDSRALDAWIDRQVTRLTSPRETNLLAQISDAYDVYQAAARNLHEGSDANQTAQAAVRALAELQQEARGMVKLGYLLADAHRESLDAFLHASNRTLARLRALLLAALALLAAAGAALALHVYRDLIAPLRVRLLEQNARLAQHEKLASLGTLAAGIAHEIRNPLAAIRARLFTLQPRQTPGTPDGEDAAIIDAELTRLERIVGDFLRFARPSDPDLRVVEAGVPLADLLSLLGPQLEADKITLELEPPPAACVRVDLDQIKQVLLNLVRNAADATGPGGRIRLRARIDHKPLAGKTTEVVILEVQDNGDGIPPEIQQRLFDPFFTTKDAGTGLGLSIAARIVEKHGGALQFQTREGVGTTFGIVLPRACPEPGS